ncbi:MAG: hypothetical protein Q8R15_00115 [Candidatus Micrarchaeota archaeon]|nr:hypothetical protein [Candidatus Micrarchaeota archaeon]
MNILPVLSKPKYLAIFFACFIVATAVYFIATGTYVISLGQFLEIAEPLRVALLLVISLLTAIAVTLAVYKNDQPLVCSANAPGLLGSVIALFTTSCSICFPLLLSALGIGGGFALAVSQNAVPLQLASIALLLGSIWLSTK